MDQPQRTSTPESLAMRLHAMINSNWITQALSVAAQLPVFRANNPPLHAHEKAPQSFPEAALRGDAGGRSAH
jgi:hypothetical protein